MCGKAFVKKKALDDHERNIHLKPFKCNFCDSAFGTNSMLRRHVMARHSQVKMR